MNEVNPYESPTADASLGDDEAYAPKMFAFSGRIGRGRYLLYSMIYNLILGLFVGLLSAAFGMTGMLEGEAAAGFSGLILVFYAVSIAIFFILVRRRLNDLDRSGWWGLLIVVPLVNLILALYLLLGPGTDGANRFGPPPTKSPTAAIIAVVLIMIAILAAVAIPAYQDYVQRAAELQGQVAP